MTGQSQSSAGEILDQVIGQLSIIDESLSSVAAATAIVTQHGDEVPIEKAEELLLSVTEIIEQRVRKTSMLLGHSSLLSEGYQLPADAVEVEATEPVVTEERTSAKRLSHSNGVTRGKQDETTLKLSFDRKVSPLGTYQKSRRRWVPVIPNSFGLTAGDSCPGKTPFCEDCYASYSQQGKGVKDLLDYNLELLQGLTQEEMVSELDRMVTRYEVEANRHHLPYDERIFRIHWSGDFFSREYAAAWREVIHKHSDVQFWTYTRSFDGEVNVIPELWGIENLSLYLSVDKDNYEAAQKIAEQYPGINIAYSGKTYVEAANLEVGKNNRRICPENLGNMALMNDGRGACVDCMICPEGRGDVVFAVTNHETKVTLSPTKSTSSS